MMKKNYFSTYLNTNVQRHSMNFSTFSIINNYYLDYIEKKEKRTFVNQ